MVLAFWAAVAVDRRSRRARRRRHHLLLLRSRAPGQSQRVTYAPILEVARRGDRCDDRLCRADPMGPTARTPMTPWRRWPRGLPWQAWGTFHRWPRRAPRVALSRGVGGGRTSRAERRRRASRRPPPPRRRAGRPTPSLGLSTRRDPVV